jgi:hypothetical protein
MSEERDYVQERAIAFGRAMGRRQAAERSAQLLRALVARWSARIASRGFVLGPLLAELTRGFVADVEHEAEAIEAQLPLAKAEERRLKDELDTAISARARDQARAEQAAARKPWWRT